ncbi:MAG: bifunctional hydroxymethylpyrimidine kinase/phosphomethylpyrimidine kinase [Mariprofundus sp.]
MNKQPVCLTIGGSDSGGGAGIQADLRVFESLNVLGCSAITALTAQNPQRITRIEAVSLAQLDAEMHAVFDYYDVAAVKTGMLLDAEHVALVSALLSELHDGALIIDPVMIASSGKTLLEAGAVDTMIKALLPQATLITPNLDEAESLFGISAGVQSKEEMQARKAMQAFAQHHDCAVLLKGGHGDTDQLLDLLCEANGEISEFSHPRQDWTLQQRHGTGCRLASAVSAYLAYDLPLQQAVAKSIAYLQDQ